VLQVSPVLLERYLSVARKISRAAVGDTNTPVAYQTYTISSRTHSRMIVCRTTFAPTGSARPAPPSAITSRWTANMRFSVTLQRNRNDEYLASSTSRKLDLRLDDQGCNCLPIPASAKKIVLGGGTPPDAGSQGAFVGEGRPTKQIGACS